VTNAAQIEVFEDTWHWNEQAEREFDEFLYHANTSVADMIGALREAEKIRMNAAMKLCLLSRTGSSFLVLKPKALAADTTIGKRLIVWACMEKVNPDLVVRYKRGRSYAERQLSERPWDTRSLACLVYKLKVAVQRTATFEL
jgi:hypothetical protein